MTPSHTNQTGAHSVARVRPLVPFGLTYSDLLEVLLACTPVRPNGCPAWLFREILIRGLADQAPRLAFKIGMLEDEQTESLCHFIEAMHVLTENPDVEVVYGRH
jgi:hypothetical protein